MTTSYGLCAAALNRAAVPIVPAVAVDVDLAPPEIRPAEAAPRPSRRLIAVPASLATDEPF